MRHGKQAARLALAVAAALTLSAPVFAAGASPVTIRIEVIGGTETFTTTGDALCPAGTATTDVGHFGGGPVAGSFHGSKTLDCTDGSGSFRITFDAATVFGAPQDQGGWHVIDGTDAYATLRGGGNLVGTYVEGGIIDLYTGRVQL
jgi:hypothetical protein